MIFQGFILRGKCEEIKLVGLYGLKNWISRSFLSRMFTVYFALGGRLQGFGHDGEVDYKKVGTRVFANAFRGISTKFSESRLKQLINIRVDLSIKFWPES